MSARRGGGGARIVRLAAISAVVKGPGFLIPLIIAAFFGAGHVTDAYFLAYGGVLLVGGTVGQPLEAVVVPFAAHALVLGRRSAARFMRQLSTQGLVIGLVAGLVGALLIGVGMRFSKPSGVDPGTVFRFYALLAPAAVAWCIAGLYSGSLVSGWHLEIGAIGYGFRGAGALVGAVAGVLVHQLWPVAVGVSLGEWGRVLWLRGHWRRAIAGLAEGTTGTPERGLLAAAGHQMGAQGLLSGAQFVERFLVGTVAVAAISRVEYANRLIMVASVLFDGGVAPWLLAHWSNVRVRDTLRADWATVYRPIAFAALAAVSVAAVIAVGAPLMVRVVLHHGAFTGEDAAAVSQVLRWYAAGYFFNMVALCVERLLLARVQNRLFLILSAVRAGTRIATILFLLPTVGIIALPVGYLVSEALYASALLLSSRVMPEARVA